MRTVPPRPAEFLQVPVNAAKSWLAGGPEEPVADVTTPDDLSDLPPSREPQPADWVRWEGLDKGPQRITVDDIRPGDVIIVDPSRGGISNGNWDPGSADAVDDLGDQAQLAYRKRATLRLDQRLIPDAPLPPTEEDVLDFRQTVEEWLAGRSEGVEKVLNIIERLECRGYQIESIEGPPEYLVLVERRRNAAAVDGATLDGSDYSASHTGAGVTLRYHMDRVGDRAARYARNLGFHHTLQEDLRLAGRLHDLGKVDPRFQLQLVGGNQVKEAMLTEPLAKSLPGVRWARLYPTGMRHEVASLAMVQSGDTVLDIATDRDLVLHLILTHHGWARPLPPIIEDPDTPINLTYNYDGHILAATSNLVDTGIALQSAARFWRLTARYGHHGLAWMEAILRLADHRQSEAEVG